MTPRPIGPRERLLLALDQLTAENTVLDVGINSLLERSGVAKASLYANFASKDELIVAWLEARQDTWFGFFESHIERHAPGAAPDKVLDAAFDFLDVWFAREDFSGCPFIATFLQLKDANHPAAVAAKKYATRLHQFFVTQVAALQRPDAPHAASALFSLFIGAVVTRQMSVGGQPALAARHAARAIYTRPAGRHDNTPALAPTSTPPPSPPTSANHKRKKRHG